MIRNGREGRKTGRAERGPGWGGAGLRASQFNTQSTTTTVLKG